MRAYMVAAPVGQREAPLAREEEIRGQVVVCSLKDLRQLATLLLEALLLENVCVRVTHGPTRTIV